MEQLIALAVVSWLAAGWAAAGFFYAYFQRKYPLSARDARVVDGVFAGVLVFGGAIAFFVSFLLGGHRYGWKLPFSRSDD